MNGKLLLSLFAGLLLAIGAGATWAQEVECDDIEMKDKVCRNDKHYPIVTIHIAAKKKVITPLFVCAARGSVIEFRVVPPGKTESGSVDVKAKEESNDWLIGTNFPDKTKIEVRVPRWVEDESDHDYNIFFADGSCIDPRVHVQD